jgi:hypothetical protein
MVDLAVVYSREKDDKEIHFGVSGYTMNRTFVLFDRNSDSVWYPGKNGELNAVGGPRLGETIPTAVKNEMMPLSEWLEKHPESKILLPPPHSKTVHDLK